MISIIEGIISIFPISFLAYSMSERLIAKHESRVGKKIDGSDFVWQTWVDACLELKKVSPTILWLLYALQFSIIFLFNLNVEFLAFVYLALNGFALAYLAGYDSGAVKKIASDRLQTGHAVASGIAALCIFGCFTLSKSSSLAQVHWSWLELLFVVPFQLAGMILFGEQPFQGMRKKTGWIDSARFYAWSMLAAKLFLGGGAFFIDLHVKAAALYLIFRTFGIYFPKYQQRDLLRISILYLFPITGLVWLVAMLIHGMIEAGVGIV